MSARTVPSLPTWAYQQEITSSDLQAITTWGNFWCNPPMFSMHQTASQNVLTGAYTQITCDAPDYDSDFGRQLSSPFSYTIPLGMGGRWTFTGQVIFVSNTTGQRIAALFQNGVQVTSGSTSFAAPVPGGSVGGAMVTRTLTVAAGDVIGLYAYQGSGGTLATNVSLSLVSYFEGRMVSQANP